MDRADTILVVKCVQGLIHDPDDNNNLFCAIWMALHPTGNWKSNKLSSITNLIHIKYTILYLIQLSSSLTMAGKNCHLKSKCVLEMYEHIG
jgi:hypothetical protein